MSLLLPTSDTILGDGHHALMHRIVAVDSDAPEQSLNVNSDGSITVSNGGLIGSGSADSSAILTINSTTKGLLPPRMTTAQRDAVTSPATGLLLYNTTTGKLTVRDSGGWTELGSGGGSAVWGAITGTLANQTDLQTALDAKASLASPTFTGTVSVPATNFTVGASIPFSDSAGTLTLQNVDALDATTEATIESAIDTLANLTSIQGQTVSLSGSLTVSASANISQDYRTSASPTFTGLTLSGLTASLLVATDASKNLLSLTTTTYPNLTEISYVKGVTSPLQTQIDTKQATITGGATTIVSSDLTASRALVSTAGGKVGVSSVTSTELGHVSGVTSGIQTQLDAKQPLNDILTDLAGLTQATDKLPYFSSATAMATTDLTSFARTLLDDSSASTARTTLGLVIGTDVQAYSSVLSDLTTKWTPASATAQASLQFHEDTDNGTNKVTLQAPASLSADIVVTLPSSTGTLVLTSDLSAYANTALSNLASVAINTTLVSDTDNTDDIGSSLIFWRTGYFKTSIELGATDTTITRASAGNIAIEGNLVYRAGGTDVPVTDGGTGVSAISALSVWVANSANTITEVTPSAGQSIRVNAGGTAWEAFTPSSATAGGSNTQLQYNNSGSFGGISGATTDGTNLQLSASALRIADTNASHYLVITPGSDLTANRVLTLTTGDSARTITLSGNPTLDDWFDQSVKTGASPTFVGATLSGATASTIAIFNGSKAIISADTTTYPSLTEFSYVKGVSSAIQTQLNSKQASITGTDTRVLFFDGNNNPAGDAGMTYDKASDTLTLVGDLNIGNALSSAGDLDMSAVGAITATSGNGGASEAGKDIAWYAGSGGSGNTAGGNILIKAGTKSGSGSDGYVKLIDPSSGIGAIFNLASLADSDKTFTLPNTTGTVALTTSNVATATALQNARTIGGVSFDGTANITVATATGGFTVSGGNLALGTNSITMSGSIGVTGTRVTKLWATDIESTNMPTVGGVAILTSLTAPQFTTIELGHASDTTLSRVSAGVIAVEGATIPTVSSSNTWTGVNDFGGATSLELPNGTSITLDADGEIGVDTSVTDWSHGILEYFSTELLGVVAMPIAQFSSPQNGYVVAYNATNDEFELVAQTGGSGANTALSNLASVAINTSLLLGTSDAGALGSTTKMWSDLFLADGGVINWNNGNATLTHSTSLLTSNVSLSLGTSNALTTGTIELGHASDTTISRLSAGVIGVEGVQVLTVAGGTLTGSIILGENTGIALDPAGSADGKWSGITVTGTAGYTQAFGDLVYLDPTDSRWEACDANAASGNDGDTRGNVGIVVSAGTDGNPCTILLCGIVRADAKFPTFTINNPIYASETAGSVTQTQPTTTDVVVRVLGFALTADEMFFNPSGTWFTHV